jgi:regulator of RNase E activity RraA
VAVFPNDVILVDQDGAVLIPAALLADVVTAAVEQERFENWIMSQVEQGAVLPGLYPPNEENLAKYKAYVASGGK